MRFRVIPIILLIVSLGCQRGFTPKPRGYFRIDLPQKSYSRLQTTLPFTFEVPDYSVVSSYTGVFDDDPDVASWLNLDFPDFSAHIHLTYKTVENNLKDLIDDAHTFAYKHSVKADAINQIRFSNQEASVYGVKYEIKGNTASSVQFFCTDSIKNFLRGALYFDTEPNKDSLAPVVEFLGQDLNKLMESLEWNEIKK
jgi:gliding motility-associated lipoprotein GldD